VDDLVTVIVFAKGQTIVDRGHIITPRHIKIVQKMVGTRDARLTRGQILLGTIVLVIGLLAAIILFSHSTIRKFHPTPRDMVFLGTAVLTQIGLLQGLIYAFDVLGDGWSSATPQMLYYAVPMALGAMLVRLVLNSETALVYTLIIAVLSGFVADQSLGFATFVMATSVVGATKVGRVSQRLDLLKAGLWVGAIGASLALGIYLAEGGPITAAFAGSILAGLVGGVLSGVLVNAVLPIVETLFRYTTDIKLLELADLNHPALKELILKAPGTYHHSIVVGTLAKEAAEAINANPLLARVGSYYHDLGKGKNQQYFAENLRGGRNPHDKLKPHMSALIIKSHVKDGLEIARSYKLPPEILDFIAQHHGTTLISYFFHRAKSQEHPDIPEVNEEDYRYPGPKPQTRETAIVALADGIEAASRAMRDPTPARLQGLVQKMINQLFADGQLNECDLTLKDLHAIAKAFIQVLTSMYYTRPQYPDHEENPGARAAQKRKDKESTTDEMRRGELTDSGERRRDVTPRRSGDREALETAEYRRGAGTMKAGPTSTTDPLATHAAELPARAQDASLISGDGHPPQTMETESGHAALDPAKGDLKQDAQSGTAGEKNSPEGSTDGTGVGMELEPAGGLGTEDDPDDPQSEDGTPLRRLGL
jgi:putative nucleotidyltransferase with HDIG domain